MEIGVKYWNTGITSSNILNILINKPNPKIAIQKRNKLFPCDFISYFNNFPSIV